MVTLELAIVFVEEESDLPHEDKDPPRTITCEIESANPYEYFGPEVRDEKYPGFRCLG